MNLLRRLEQLERQQRRQQSLTIDEMTDAQLYALVAPGTPFTPAQLAALSDEEFTAFCIAQGYLPVPKEESPAAPRKEPPSCPKG